MSYIKSLLVAVSLFTVACPKQDVATDAGAADVAVRTAIVNDAQVCEDDAAVPVASAVKPVASAPVASAKPATSAAPDAGKPDVVAAKPVSSSK